EVKATPQSPAALSPGTRPHIRRHTTVNVHLTGGPLHGRSLDVDAMSRCGRVFHLGRREFVLLPEPDAIDDALASQDASWEPTGACAYERVLDAIGRVSYVDATRALEELTSAPPA